MEWSAFWEAIGTELQRPRRLYIGSASGSTNMSVGEAEIFWRTVSRFEKLVFGLGSTSAFRGRDDRNNGGRGFFRHNADCIPLFHRAGKSFSGKAVEVV